MDAYETILTRRSIRRYTNQDVSEEMVEKLLRAGMAAPSAGNQQPWHFLVIRDRDTLVKITEVHPHSKMLLTAPLAILVAGDEKLQIHPGYWLEDCSAATENILLAAHALGLGAVWLGVYPREDRLREINSVLTIPAEITPLCLISVGYPQEPKPAADRYLAERVHFEKW
ncbi:nitroreductase family protein [bacterium]|nr:nitroreductase family protein [bacterium]